MSSSLIAIPRQMIPLTFPDYMFYLFRISSNMMPYIIKNFIDFIEIYELDFNFIHKLSNFYIGRFFEHYLQIIGQFSCLHVYVILKLSFFHNLTSEDCISIANRYQESSIYHPLLWIHRIALIWVAKSTIINQILIGFPTL